MKQISQHIATLFILLNIIIFPVSAIENYNPFSNNTINHDTDKDGMWDEEEELFGTDPNDADDNYESLRARNQISTSCFDITPIFNGILSESEKEKLIRQLESYSVQDINTLADYNQQKIDALLESASISAEQIEYGGEGLTTLIKNAEEIDFVQNGVSGVFIITGKYGRTSFSPLIASCTGTIIGILYGSGMGVKDDASFTYSLIKGIWHYATHIREISNVWGAVVNFVKSINWGTIDSMFRSVSLDIVKRGKDVIDFFDLKPTSAEYASYQMGFYGGYIAGYIAEQVAFLKGIGEAFKSLKVGAKLGHTVSRATEILARITNKFGGHVADSLRGLRIWQKAVKWGDDVIDGLAFWVKKGGVDDIAKYSDDVVELTSRQLNDFRTSYLSKIRASSAIGADVLDNSLKTADDYVYLAKASDNIFDGANVNEKLKNMIKLSDNLPDEIIKTQRVTFLKAAGKVQLGLENNPKLLNEFQKKINKMITESDHAFGPRGEILSLARENFDDILAIDKQIIDNGITKGAPDILMKNGDIIEVKYKPWDQFNIDIDGNGDILGQIERASMLQTNYIKGSSNNIIVRKVVDGAVDSVEDARNLVPDSTIDIINSNRKKTGRKNIHLEIIGAEGKKWEVI